MESVLSVEWVKWHVEADWPWAVSSNGVGIPSYPEEEVGWNQGGRLALLDGTLTNRVVDLILVDVPSVLVMMPEIKHKVNNLSPQKTRLVIPVGQLPRVVRNHHAGMCEIPNNIVDETAG